MKPKGLIQSLMVTVLVAILSMDFFFDIPIVNTLAISFRSYVVPISSFTLCAGVIGLYMQHLKTAIKQEEYWPYSLVTVICLTISIISGIWFKDIAQWIHINISEVLVNAMATFFCMFLVSSGYRSFRIRNFDATLLLIAAIITLLLNTPAISSWWSFVPIIGTWVMDVPAMTAMRAINIGTAIGIFGIAVRTMLGQEKTISAEV